MCHRQPIRFDDDEIKIAFGQIIIIVLVATSLPVPLDALWFWRRLWKSVAEHKIPWQNQPWQMSPMLTLPYPANPPLPASNVGKWRPDGKSKRPNWLSICRCGFR